MGLHTESPDRITQEGEEANIGVENQARATSNTTALDRPQTFKTRNWWIWIFVCSGLVVTGRVFSTLLLNFYFVQTGRDVCDDPKQFKGTWLQSVVQNAAFPFTAFFAFLWRCLSSNHRETTSSCSSSFGKLFLLYISLGVLFATYSQLYAIGRTHCIFFFWIFTTQLIFTSIFTAVINKHKFNRWIILSIILSGVATGITSSDDAYIPCEGEGYKMSYGAWCGFFGTVAFSLSLCIMQLGFEKVILKRESKVSAVMLIQTYASLIATLICLVGLFVSGEFRDIKEDFETFKKRKPLYVFTLIGLSLSWQVMSIGLVGLVCLVSTLFSNVVSFCATPLANILVVVAFGFMDDDIELFKGGALLAGILGFASYIYSLYKSVKKRASQSETLSLYATGDQQELVLSSSEFYVFPAPSGENFGVALMEVALDQYLVTEVLCWTARFGCCQQQKRCLLGRLCSRLVTEQAQVREALVGEMLMLVLVPEKVPARSASHQNSVLSE
ncbi:hypothetical protein Bca101_043955 [Brassica carinata]